MTNQKIEHKTSLTLIHKLGYDNNVIYTQEIISKGWNRKLLSTTTLKLMEENY